ncbi:MAG: hypothetical protein AB7Q00_02315 [Phycisphaerales bacterium]
MRFDQRMSAAAMAACVGLGGLGVHSAHAQALTTRFTYQGRLDVSGSPASGLHDIRFSLFPSAVGGTQVGTTLCADNLGVSDDGTFVVGLDFGDVFDGNERYLQIEVRQDTGLSCANTTGYTTLSGRQRLLATPHSAFSLKPWETTSTGRLRYDGVFVGINATTPVTGNAQFQVSRTGAVAGAFGGMFVTTDNATGKPFYGYNNTTGSTLAYHYLDGSDNSWRLQVGSSLPLVVTSNGNVGLGTTTPLERLHVVGNSFVTGASIVNGNQTVGGSLTVSGPINVPTTTRYYTMGPGSFIVAPASANYNMTSQELFLLDNTGGYYGHLNLPQGAVLLDAQLYFYDQSNSNNITFILNRVPHDGTTAVNLASFTPSLVAPAGNLVNQTLSFPDEVIDNQTNTYTMYMTWDPDGGNRISVRSVVFRYTVTTPMP